MARKDKKLTAIEVKNLKKPGRYNDGGGLYLLVKPDGGKYWLFRYRDRTTGKHRDKGLGSYADVPAPKAREKANGHRTSLLNGIDPIDATRQAREDIKLARAKEITFGDCAKQCIEAKKPSWRNTKHAAQWASTIDTYCSELLTLPVSKIDTDLVIKVLNPIWTAKTETATRVRQRVEIVLDWATVRNFRSGNNPARWKGHLESLLASPAKLKNVQHRAALRHDEIAAFVTILSTKSSLAAKALTLQILTATRPSEAIAARWTEFDLEQEIWVIPKERMKAKREHKVPLSSQLLAMLSIMPRHESGFLFPGKSEPGKLDKHITTASTLKLLQGIHPAKTCHGFRSTFRDWAADSTSYSREVAEAALAHMIKDQSEAAYRRTTMLEKRANLMQDWATHCYATSAG